MKKVFFILSCILLNSCVGGKDLYYTVLQPGDELKNAKDNLLNHSTFNMQLQEFVDSNGLVNYAAWKQQHSDLKKYFSIL